MKLITRLRHGLSSLAWGIPTVCLHSFEILLRRPRALAPYQAEISRRRRQILGKELPSITPSELLEHDGAYTLTLGGEGGIDPNANNFEFLKIVAMLKPEAAFEIGTFLGQRAILIASHASDDVRVYTLDLPGDAETTPEMTDPHLRKRTSEVLFDGTRWKDNITQLWGDSASFDFSPYHGQMDLVYIDGSHSYEYVSNDTKKAMAMVRPGGVIIWDDYRSVRANYGVRRFLDGLRKKGYPVWRFELTRAILLATEDVITRYHVESP